MTGCACSITARRKLLRTYTHTPTNRFNQVALLKQLGFDSAFNHKSIKIREALEQHCPEGIDIYFGGWAGGLVGGG